MQGCALHGAGLLLHILCHCPGKTKCHSPRCKVLTKPWPPHTLAESMARGFNLSLPGCPAKNKTVLGTGLQMHTGPLVFFFSARNETFTEHTLPPPRENLPEAMGRSSIQAWSLSGLPAPPKKEQCSRVLTEHYLGCPLTRSAAQPSQAPQA